MPAATRVWTSPVPTAKPRRESTANPAVASPTANHAIGVMRSAAQDLGPRGVRVNALAPGPIANDALTGRIAARHAAGGPPVETALSGLAREAMLGRLATRVDVANLAHFLSSDAAAGLTGHVYPVDAGLA